jgi:Zinc knuckle
MSSIQNLIDLSTGLSTAGQLIASVDGGTTEQQQPTGAGEQLNSTNSVLFNLAGLSIREYDGNEKHQSLDAFMENIERVHLSRPKITEEELIRLAVSKCTGHAYKIIRKIAKSITTLEDLREALRLGCCIYDNPENYETQLATCKQEKNETVSDFYRRICEIQENLQRCSKKTSETETEQLLRHREEQAKVLRRGLLSPIKDFVRRLNIQDVDSILKYAMEDESCAPAQAATTAEMVAAILPVLENKFDQLTLQVTQAAQAVPAAPVTQFQAMPAAPVNQFQVAAVPQQMQQQTHQFQPSGYGQMWQQPPQLMQHPPMSLPLFHPQGQQQDGKGYGQTYKGKNNKKGDKQIVCFNCQKPGHYKTDCRGPFACSYCGQKGHGVTTCPQVPCTLCSGYGHTPARCQSKVKSQQPDANQPKNL